MLASMTATFYMGFYLFRKRKSWQGYYWDEEGIVIDFKDNKVYWHEIENIQLMTHQSFRSTIISTHYTHYEKIRERRKKMIPTTAHSIDWFMIENPKEYHTNLIQAWEEKQQESLQKIPERSSQV
jgi:hypothetical protein